MFYFAYTGGHSLYTQIRERNKQGCPNPREAKPEILLRKNRKEDVELLKIYTVESASKRSKHGRMMKER